MVDSAVLQLLLQRLRPLGELRSNRMFGGFGIYANRRFFAIVDGETAYFKTDKENAPAFEKHGSEAFQPIPDKGPMGYHELPPEALHDEDLLLELARSALATAERAASRRRPRKAQTDPTVGRLRGLGPKSAALLRSVGIPRRSQLEAHGAIGAFLAVEAEHGRQSLNLLYALEAALLDEHWAKLPAELKARLREAAGR